MATLEETLRQKSDPYTIPVPQKIPAQPAQPSDPFPYAEMNRALQSRSNVPFSPATLESRPQIETIPQVEPRPEAASVPTAPPPAMPTQRQELARLPGVEGGYVAPRAGATPQEMEQLQKIGQEYGPQVPSMTGAERFAQLPQDEQARVRENIAARETEKARMALRENQNTLIRMGMNPEEQTIAAKRINENYDSLAPREQERVLMQVAKQRLAAGSADRREKKSVERLTRNARYDETPDGKRVPLNRAARTLDMYDQMNTPSAVPGNDKTLKDYMTPSQRRQAMRAIESGEKTQIKTFERNIRNARTKMAKGEVEAKYDLGKTDEIEKQVATDERRFNAWMKQNEISQQQAIEAEERAVARQLAQEERAAKTAEEKAIVAEKKAQRKAEAEAAKERREEAYKQKADLVPVRKGQFDVAFQEYKDFSGVVRPGEGATYTLDNGEKGTYEQRLEELGNKVAMARQAYNEAIESLVNPMQPQPVAQQQEQQIDPGLLAAQRDAIENGAKYFKYNGVTYQAQQ